MHRHHSLSHATLSGFSVGKRLRSVLVLYCCLIMATFGVSLPAFSTEPVQASVAESLLIDGAAFDEADSLFDELQTADDEEDVEDDYHAAFGRETPDHGGAVRFIGTTPEWRCHDAPLWLRPPILV